MDWRDDLEACFSKLDRLFTAHAMDEIRAFRLLASARDAGIGWVEMSNAIRNLMENDGCSAPQIEMQVAEAEQRFRPWLRD
jgi:hypothetical protein